MTGPNSLTLNDGKAGMEGLDKGRINRIIRETSKGSLFYQHVQKKEEELKRKIDKMLEEREELTEQMIKQSEEELGVVLARLDSARDTTRDIVHVDMDAFYAAVEMRDNPTLRDIPMAVGSSAMLSTSNYLARRYGVRAAMPGFIAKKLCPHLVIVPGNHEKYGEVSSQIMTIIGKYTTEYSAMSLDEVYCDMTGVVRRRTLSSELCPLHGATSSDTGNHTTTTLATEDKPSPGKPSSDKPSSDKPSPDKPSSDKLPGKPSPGKPSSDKPSPDKPSSDTPSSDKPSSGKLPDKPSSDTTLCWCSRESVIWNIVQELRRDIQQATQLTASAGISCNTFLAKVCSDLNKPNGQYYLPSDRAAILDFVAELEIKKVPGIGGVQQAHLSALGINKISDIIAHRGTLAHLFTQGTVHFYLTTALGLGSNQVGGRDEGRSSMSTESTFSPTNVNKDNKLTQEILVILSGLSETLANRLKAQNLSGETVSVKLKLSSFEVLQRSRTQCYAVGTKDGIEYVAKELLAQLVRDQLTSKGRGTCLSARLLGVRVHKFVSSTTQSSILTFTRGQHPANSRTWDCPVCGASLPARIVPFNKHVDSCVTNPGSMPEQPVVAEQPPVVAKQPPVVAEQPPVVVEDTAGKMKVNQTPEKVKVSHTEEKVEVSHTEEKVKVSHTEEKVEGRDSSSLSDTSGQRGRKRKLSGDVVELEGTECLTKSHHLGKWECPVCSKMLSPDLATFTIHIDRCLAQGSTPSSSSSAGSGQSLLKYFKRSSRN